MMKRNNNALCVSAGKAMKNKAQFTRYRLLNSVGGLALGAGAEIFRCAVGVGGGRHST